MKLLVLIYDLVLWIYVLGIRVFALFNPKARLWIGGRKHVMKQLEAGLLGKGKLVWIHCASLGEFEQGRPVLESIHSQFPNVRILLTFFSPSGFEVRKNDPLANLVVYLPSDTRSHARQFIGLVQPALVIFVKYEFWYHYAEELHQRNIPTLLITAVFRPGQVFFKWYGMLFRRIISYYHFIFVQDGLSLSLLQQWGYFQAAIGGDTRFDRVTQLKNQEPLYVLPPDFLENSPGLVVAGSTWPADEKLLARFLIRYGESLNLKLVIAPHEISVKHLQQIEKLFPGSVRLSDLPAGQSASALKVVIVDSLGKLAYVYREATIAYIGGGFGAGIHNILEAAVYGPPVFFGLHYQKFNEAVLLIREGGAFSISRPEDLWEKGKRLLDDQALMSRTRTINRDFVQTNAGATERIMTYIAGKRFLTTP